MSFPFWLNEAQKIMLYLFGHAWSQILCSSLVKPRWQGVFFGGVSIGSWNYPNNNKLPKLESILISSCIFEHSFFDTVIHRKIKQAGHNHMKFHMPGQSSQIKHWYNTTTLSNHRQETSSRCPHDSLCKNHRWEPELFPQPRWWLNEAIMLLVTLPETSIYIVLKIDG